MRRARSWARLHFRDVAVAALVLAIACGGGGAGTIEDGGVTTTQTGADGGTASDARAKDATTSTDGATTLDRCAQAGGTCLSSGGGQCATGTYRDDGRSCPPASGDGPNTPCCIPVKDGKACEGLPPIPWSSPPTHCGDQTCAAGSTHCENVAPGEPGGTATIACGSAAECATCLSCACIKRLDRYTGSCGSCSEAGGKITLACAAP